MSYILDALKKSDQERQQGTTPSLQTIHRPHGNNAERGWLNLLLALVVLLVLSLAGLLSWFFLGDSDASIALAKPEAQVKTKPLSLLTDSYIAVDTGSSIMVEPTITSPPVSATKSRVVVPFSELPVVVRNAIPAMTFSFHVYSKNPERRTIIIDGRRVKQGAVIDDQLLLDEITPNGVIFSWQDHQFSIPVVEAW